MSTPSPSAHRRRVIRTLALSLLSLVVAGIAPQVAAATVARGIADPTLTQPGTRMEEAYQREVLGEIGTKLKASYVRFVVSWAQAEPQRGVLNETYLAGIDRAVALAKENGLRAIITFSYMPKWASNRAFWYKNPFPDKGYHWRYAMKTDQVTLSAWQRFCRRVALRWHAWGYECWNEPNLHATLYPQATAKDPNYGPHVYIQMLKKFAAGIRAGDPLAKRLAGATSPKGFLASDSLAKRQLMTSPQRFAQQIKAAGVSSLFYGYTHHPYTPGATVDNWPEALPRDPKNTVNLRNLGALLKIFPKKPFYLTEYGYQTAASKAFAFQFISLEKQADYLRRAYDYVARHEQVKLLMWFLLDDWSPSYVSTDTAGMYTGLRFVDQQKKPSWYTFAGGNHLTLTAPSSVAAGAALTLTGLLNSDIDGLIADKQLVVEGRTGTGSWTTVGSAQTDAAGAYSVTLYPTESRDYRVEWPGVVTSPVVSVAIQ